MNGISRKFTQLQREYDEFAYPGKKLGVIEEFVPGSGVYCQNGEIRAKFVGVARKNVIEKTVRVDRVRRKLLIQIGDEVIGRVTELAGVYGVAKIEFVNGKITNKFISAVIYPTRHLKENEKQYKVGDVILAKVESLKNRILHLSIKERRYGVIMARCSTCGNVLALVKNGENGILICKRCKNEERRKVSDLYGNLEELLKT